MDPRRRRFSIFTAGGQRTAAPAASSCDQRWERVGVPARDTEVTRTDYKGCGNSPLSADMYRDGFHRITNIDYSPACIRRMAHKHDNMAAMTFPDGTFEVVLEKGTLDAFMVAEKSPWTVPEETAQFCLAGRFISISFAQPHFRTPLYVNDAYGWSVRTDKFGDCFHFFFYTMEHGGTLTQQQREQAHRFVHPPAVDMTPVCLSDSEEDFLRRIDISPYKKRQGANNNSSNMLDILKTLHSTPPAQVPMFASLEIDRVEVGKQILSKDDLEFLEGEQKKMMSDEEEGENKMQGGKLGVAPLHTEEPESCKPIKPKKRPIPYKRKYNRTDLKTFQWAISFVLPPFTAIELLCQ
ncbi:ECE2 [Branchiostoma lanceolatum]|uniref:ECE2 protein n=1 Tax=Branchiostoma lanceolatum TaxID=7740 RepID=A0A8K0A367_BRALA|nr:ECE2 [Branchiostoma lanceolatum]